MKGKGYILPNGVPVTILAEELKDKMVKFYVKNEHGERFMLTLENNLYKWSNSLRKWVLIKDAEECYLATRKKLGCSKYNLYISERVDNCLNDLNFVALTLINL